MTRTAYGRTWWGAQWLQALAHIDHDNRLPRGRSYANKGAVRGMAVQDGSIRAKVQGSRAQPYAVDIQVPPLNEADAQRLVRHLTADPGLVARLLNRDLDPSVLDAARTLKIAVFPSRWQDLTMHCSCPDWAVPCKHLAAVVYLLSAEIDGDPFLVFRLRGVDLPALLARQGVVIDDAVAAPLPASLLALFEAPDGRPDTAGAAEPPEPPEPPEPAGDDGQPPAAIDFTTIPDLLDPIWRLLPAQPVFWRGSDFRESARAELARIAREARRRLSLPLPDNDAATAAPLPEGRLRVSMDVQGTLVVSGARLGNDAIGTWSDAMQCVTALPTQALADLPTEFALLATLRLLALHLLARGAVVPQVFAPDGQTAGLSWCPAELDPTVRSIVQQLAAGWPADLLQQRQGKRLLPLPVPSQVRLLLSALVDSHLRALAQPDARSINPKVQALFFGAGFARFDAPGEGAIPGSVQAWLSRLHLTRQAQLPVLKVEEAADDGFALSVAVADDRATLDAPTPLAKVLSQPAWADRRMAVLKTVALLAEFIPALNDHVRAGARLPVPVSPQALPPLLFDALPALRLMGVRTLLPRALERLWRPRLSVHVKAPADGLKSVLTMDSLLSFDWQVAIGDERLTPAAFEKLIGKAEGVVRLRGQYVYLDPQELAALRARLARPEALNGADLLRTALAGEFDGAPVSLNAAARKLLDSLRNAPDVPPPIGLQATLRPYQQRGFAWLWRNTRLGLGGVIADDMGLGKTLQVLALLLRLKQDGELATGRALVVVPTSLLTNWQKEAARFTPDLSVGVFHGGSRELKAERPDLLLTTYGIARTEAARLKALAWRVVVVDEAQNIKNPGAAQAKAVKAIPAASRIAMSGTPVENRLSEYWSIMDFAQRGYLGAPKRFADEYATPIQVHRDAAAAARLRQVMAPFMLRRLKSDKSIISDLPDKLEQDQFCTLTPAQSALYETVVREGLAAIEGESDTFQRQGLVLQMILALKQVCNHPAQYLKQGAADAAVSGKAQRLMDLLDEIVAAQGKALVFTQFREMGELLVRMLAQRDGAGGRAPLFLHGGVSRAGRDEMVERFQNEPGQRVFLLSLKAGGTGLNLTAANHVVHYDLWWNPAVEAQATDRAYRIGQQRQVQVHRFITQGTFEERINEMIRAKRALAEMAVGTGETWIGQLPPDELRALFSLGGGSVQAAAAPSSELLADLPTRLARLAKPVKPAAKSTAARPTTAARTSPRAGKPRTAPG